MRHTPPARPRGQAADARAATRRLRLGATAASGRPAILDYRPCDLGLAGQLWAGGQVGELIAKLYRVRLTEQGVGTYLGRWDLAFQRPAKRTPSTARCVWSWTTTPLTAPERSATG